MEDHLNVVSLGMSFQVLFFIIFIINNEAPTQALEILRLQEYLFARDIKICTGICLGDDFSFIAEH